jgi:CheY-like chemotaxis protein
MTGRSPIDRISTLSVLLVEDDNFALKLAQSILRGLGVNQVTVARNGVEAMGALDSETVKFDLIISDWNMPIMSGLDLLKKVRATRPNMPFIMLTGKATPEFVLEARDHGVNGYVVKPFSPDQLSKRITAVMTATKP